MTLRMSIMLMMKVVMIVSAMMMTATKRNCNPRCLESFLKRDRIVSRHHL